MGLLNTVKIRVEGAVDAFALKLTVERCLEMQFPKEPMRGRQAAHLLIIGSLTKGLYADLLLVRKSGKLGDYELLLACPSI